MAYNLRRELHAPVHYTPGAPAWEQGLMAFVACHMWEGANEGMSYRRGTLGG